MTSEILHGDRRDDGQFHQKAAEPGFRSSMTVELVRHDASDESVVQAARVSTSGERSLTAAAPGEGLIGFLMRNRHGTPFEHCQMTFFIEAPIFVFREFIRHRTFSFNEESGRYRKLSPVFYVPGKDRKLVQTGKPGAYELTEGSAGQQELAVAEIMAACDQAYRSYERMLAAGICREIARAVLPVGIYSSAYATCNPRALMHFLSLRTAHQGAAFPSFPMREIEMVSEAMERQWQQLMPVTHAAFSRNGRVCP